MPFVLLILCSLNLENVKFEGAGGCLDCYGCACLLTDKCAADGGHIRDLELCGGCLVRADDDVCDLHLVRLIENGNGGTDGNNGGVDLAFIDDNGILDLILEFLDARFNSRLFCSRLIILGVLGKVSESAGYLDVVDNLGAACVLQIIKLGYELIVALLGVIDRFCCHNFSPLLTDEVDSRLDLVVFRVGDFIYIFIFE